jgi:dephospho-CoA kinase
VPLYDADAEIHKLLGPSGAAVGKVETAFSGVLGEHGGIDRARLGQRVFGKPAELRRLEKILHPMVRAVERRWIARQRGRGAKLVVLDIPLLFETDRIDRVDGVIVVSAPASASAFCTARVCPPSASPRSSTRNCRIARNGGGPILSYRRR